MKKDFIKDKSGNIKTKSPFTGDLDVIVEYDDKNGESRMCMVTGYTTSEIYKFDSSDIEKIEKSTSKFIKEMRYEDKDLGTILVFNNHNNFRGDCLSRRKKRSL